MMKPKINNTKDRVTLFASVNIATHKRLAALAVKLEVPKLELYAQALSWASRQKAFREAMEKVYHSKSKT